MKPFEKWKHSPNKDVFKKADKLSVFLKCTSMVAIVLTLHYIKLTYIKLTILIPIDSNPKLY